MTEQPSWAGHVPSYSGIRGPLPAPQWDEVSQNTLDELREKLRESITESILMAVKGFFIPGPLGTAFDQLVEWAAAILNAETLFAALSGEYEGDNFALLAIEFIFTPIRWLWESFSYVLTEFFKPVAIFLQELWNRFVADWNQIDWATPLTAVHSAWMLFVDFVLDFGPWLVSKIEEAAGLSDIPNFLATDLLKAAWTAFNAAWSSINFLANPLGAIHQAWMALVDLGFDLWDWFAKVLQNLTGISLPSFLAITMLRAAWSGFFTKWSSINFLANPLGAIHQAWMALVDLGFDLWDWFATVLQNLTGITFPSFLAITTLRAAWSEFFTKWSSINFLANPLGAIHQAWMAVVDLILDLWDWLKTVIRNLTGITVPSFFAITKLRGYWSEFFTKWTSVNFLTNPLGAIHQAWMALVDLGFDLWDWLATVIQNLTGITLPSFLAIDLLRASWSEFFTKWSGINFLANPLGAIHQAWMALVDLGFDLWDWFTTVLKNLTGISLPSFLATNLLRAAWSKFNTAWGNLDFLANPLGAIHQAWMAVVDLIFDLWDWFATVLKNLTGITLPSFLDLDDLRGVWTAFNTAWAAINFTNPSALWSALRAVLNLARGLIHWIAGVFQNLTGINIEGLLDSLGTNALAAAFIAWGDTLIGINWANPIAGLMTAIGAFITLAQDIGNWFLALIQSWLGWNVTAIHNMFSSFQNFVEGMVRYFFGDTALANFVLTINTLAGQANATLTEAIKSLNGLFTAIIDLKGFFENFNFFFKILQTFLPFVPWETIFPFVDWDEINGKTPPEFNPLDVFIDPSKVPTLDDGGKLGVDVIGDILEFAQDKITNPIIATLLTGMGIDLTKFGVVDINDLSNLNLSALGDVAGTLLTKLNEIPANLLSGVLPPSLLGVIPVANISNTTPNLITLGSFNESISVEKSDGWAWDYQSATGAGGSVKLTITSAKDRYLYSRQAVPVVKGDRLIVNVTIKTSGLQVSPAGSLPISIAIIPFIGSAEQPIVPIGNPVNSNTGWTKIGQASNTYYEVTNPSWTSVIVRLGVDSTATGSVLLPSFVWFDDVSLTKTGTMQQNLVEYLTDAWEGLWEGVFPGDGTGKTWADMQNLAYSLNDTATQGVTNAGIADGKAQATVDGINQAVTGSTSTGALPATVATNIGGVSDFTQGSTQSGINLLADPKANYTRLWTQSGLSTSTLFSYSTSQSLRFAGNGTARTFQWTVKSTGAVMPIATQANKVYYCECYVYLPTANPGTTATVAMYAQNTTLPATTGSDISPMTFTAAGTWSDATLTNPVRAGGSYSGWYKLYGYYTVPSGDGFTAGIRFTAATNYYLHVDDMVIYDVTESVNTNVKLYGQPIPATSITTGSVPSGVSSDKISYSGAVGTSGTVTNSLYNNGQGITNTVNGLGQGINNNTSTYAATDILGNVRNFLASITAGFQGQGSTYLSGLGQSGTWSSYSDILSQGNRTNTSIAKLAQSVTALQSQVSATTTGKAYYEDFSSFSNFTVTYGSGTGSLIINANNDAEWSPVNGSPRSVIGIYNTATTNANYQRISIAFATAPITDALGNAAYNYIIGRSNLLGAGSGLSSDYVFAKFSSNRCWVGYTIGGTEYYFAEAGGSSGFSHSFSAGSYYTLECGTSSGVTNYILSLNGAAILNFFNSGFASYTNDTHKYGGWRVTSWSVLGVFQWTDPPGTMASFSLADNTPQKVLGSGIRVFATDAYNKVVDSAPNTTVALSADWYAVGTGASATVNQDYKTDDLTFTSSTNTVTVSVEGWYIVEINQFIYSGGNTLLCLEQRGSKTKTYRGTSTFPSNSTTSGYIQSTFVVYCKASDTLYPSINKAGGSTNGQAYMPDATGSCWFSVNYLNKSTSS